MSMDAIKLIDTDGSNGGNALSAGIGALLGSAIGRRNGLLGGVAGSDDGASPLIMDTLNKIDTAQASSAIQTQAGFCGVKENSNNNTFQVVNGMAQGFGGLNTAITGSSSQIINALSQGFSGLNSSVITQGYESKLATQSVLQKMGECCCSIEKAVGAEGAATRALLIEQENGRLRDALCDSKADNSALRSQAFLLESQAAQSQQLDAKMQQLASLVISHMPKK